MSKKVLVIGTSPRINGNSNVLAEAFAEGAREAGNDVEFIPLAGKKIGFCLGCRGCKETHRCVIHDDADIIVQKMKDADVVAFASPIYYYEMSGQMKVLLDRTNALYTADYKFRDIYLLTTAEATSQDTPQEAINGLKARMKVFNKAQLLGTIFAGGTFDVESINGRPEVEEARKRGTEL